MDKKADYRFNIYLNPSDPMHMTAIKALNAQGRHKAQFIVNAIVHYVMDDRSQMKTIMPDKEEIRSMCREIVSEMMADTPQTPITVIREEETISDQSDQEFDFGSIAETLNGFRKK